MTIDQALKLAAEKLGAKHINLPRLEAEILLSGILKKPIEFLLVHGEIKLTPKANSRYQQLLKKRLKGEPIAYLTGHKEFFGLDFMVNKNVLIPRPETELMVEEALRLIAHNSQLVTFIDIGTGSGCIIISLVKNFISKFLTSLPTRKAEDPQFLASDISLKALAIAKKNARSHYVYKQIKFIQGDLLTPVIHDSLFMIHSSLIILANLPYIRKTWKNNCSADTIGLNFEPKIALFTGKRGLELYEKLFKQISILCVMRYALRDITVMLEFDPRQAKMMKKLIKRELPQAKIQIKKDLAGLDRFAILQINL